MAWAVPFTATTGQVVTAANLNEVRDNLRYLKGLDGSVVLQNDYNLEKAGGPTLTLKNTNNTSFYAGVLQAVNSSGSLRGQIGVWIGGGFFMAGGGTNPAGYMAVWSESGIVGSARTVIPAGVTRRYYITGIAYNTSTGVGQPITAGNGAAATTDIFSSGGDILRVTITSGAMTVARASGTSTYDVIMTVWYQ